MLPAAARAIQKQSLLAATRNLELDVARVPVDELGAER
jgi:hypothetical protein